MLAAAILSASVGSGADLPVFGSGSLTNLGTNDAARTNASAHVAWSLAIPLAGKVIGQRKGMWLAGLGWIAATLVQETFFHAPPGGGGPSYPAEVRTDLLTRIVPCAGLLAWDLVEHGSPLAPEPDAPIEVGPKVRFELPPAVLEQGKGPDPEEAPPTARLDAAARERVVRAAELLAVGALPPAALLATSDRPTPDPGPRPPAGAARPRSRRS